MKELFYSRLLDTKLVKANSALLSSLDIYHLIPNPHLRNNYWIYITLAQFWSQKKKREKNASIWNWYRTPEGSLSSHFVFSDPSPTLLFPKLFFFTNMEWFFSFLVKLIRSIVRLIHEVSTHPNFCIVTKFLWCRDGCWKNELISYQSHYPLGASQLICRNLILYSYSFSLAELICG